MSATSEWPPADWQAAMRAQLDQLQTCILRAGALGAGLAGSDTERHRLALSMGELQSGRPLPSNLEQLRIEILRITRDATIQAQAAVSRAAAAPEDPRNQPG